MTMQRGSVSLAHQAAIHQFQQDRGWIVSGYASVELMMADLIVRSQSLPEYEHFPKTPPFNVTKRLKRFREIISADGPFAPDRTALLQIADVFTASEEVRHFLVHGMARFFWTSGGDMVMSFRRYMPDVFPDDPFREMHFRPAAIARVREEATVNATAAVTAFQALHDRLGWVSLSDTPMRGLKD